MLKKKIVYIPLTLTLVAVCSAVYVLGNSETSSAGLPMNKDCTVKDWKHTVVGSSTHMGKTYKLIDSQDGKGKYHLNLVVLDNAGCKALTEPIHDRPVLGNFTPPKVAIELAKASWARDVEFMGSKAKMEARLRKTTVAQELGDNINLYSWDLTALNALNVKYPDYVKAIDAFESYEAAQKYYQQIYTDAWYKKHQPLLMKGGAH